MDDKQALVKLHLELGDLSLERMMEISKMDLDVNEKIDVANAAHKFYQEYFKDCLTRFIIQEMKFMAEYAKNNDDLQFFRGKISAFSEIDSWFKEQNGVWLQVIEESKNRVDKEDEMSS
jgi:hypothetical protein